MKSVCWKQGFRFQFPAIEVMGKLMWACPLCFKRIAVKNIQTQGAVRKAAPFCGIKHNSACSVMGESVEIPKIRHITLKKCIVML